MGARGLTPFFSVLCPHLQVSARKGTSGSKTAARGAKAVQELRESLKKGRVAAALRAHNQLTEEYDHLIVAYVGKRDALAESNTTIEAAQRAQRKAEVARVAAVAAAEANEVEAAQKTLEAEVARTKQLAAEQRATSLISTHRGCTCRADNNQCTGTCGCSGRNRGLVFPCSRRCSCDPDRCQNRDPLEKSVSIAESKIDKRVKDIIKASPAAALAALAATTKAPRAASVQTSDDQSASEEEEETARQSDRDSIATSEDEKEKKTRKSARKSPRKKQISSVETSDEEEEQTKRKRKK